MRTYGEVSSSIFEIKKVLRNGSKQQLYHTMNGEKENCE